MLDAIGTASVHTGAARGAVGARILLVSLLCFLVVLAFKAHNPLEVEAHEIRLYTDDAMRLAQTRDFLDGQGWYDLRQRRLGAEDAAPMHWSRVVDAPLALLVLGFGQFVDREQAFLAAAAVWPLVTAFLHILVSLAIATRLAGTRGLICTAIVVLPFVLFSGQLSPGRVDYHALQAVLMLAMALLLVWGSGRAWRPALAGVVACLSLAIGVETIPFVAVAALVTAGRWLLDARAARTDAAAFLLGLAIMAPAAMLLTVPPAQWAVGWCDALSVFFVSGIVAGAGLSGLSALLLPSDGPRISRVAALAGAGLVALAVTLALSAQCFTGPYADLDPETARWLSERGEVRGGLWALSQGEAMHLHRMTLWPFVGIAGLALAAASAPAGRRHAWILLLALAVTGWLTAVYQVRGVRMTLPLTVLGAGYLLAWIVSFRGFASVLKPVAIPLVLWVQTPYAAVLFERTSGKSESMSSASRLAHLMKCVGPEQMAPLAALPPGRVAASIDLGAYVLWETPHWVLASPHHRNYAGNLAAVRLAHADPHATRRILEDWRIDYVATCAGWPTNVGAAWLERDAPPDWLRPVERSGPLAIYRFEPE